MRVLCVGRHAFLSDHFCRYFRALGLECEPAVGVAEARAAAAAAAPQVMVADSQLLTQGLLDSWASDPVLRGIPVVAVSLSRRPDEAILMDPCVVVGALYLPSLEPEVARALLERAQRERPGVQAPRDAFSVSSPESVTR